MKLPIITNNNIVEVATQDGGMNAVFLVKLTNDVNYSLVVKAEGVSETYMQMGRGTNEIRWNAKMMKNVNNPLAKVRMMSLNEMVDFRAQASVLLAGNPGALNSLKNNTAQWIKMPFVNGLSNADVRNSNDENQVKSLFLKLRSPAIWEQLGNVVAVDIFNGNKDRLDPSMPNPWQNRGNVMFAEDNGRISVVGLDSFNHDSITSTDTQSFNQSLMILADTAGERQAFVQKTIRCAEKYFSESCFDKFKIEYMTVALKTSKHLIINKKDIGFLAAYEEDFNKGIVKGAKALKTYLKSKIKGYAKETNANKRNGYDDTKKVPDFIIDKMHTLGWLR